MEHLDLWFGPGRGCKHCAGNHGESHQAHVFDRTFSLLRAWFLI
jgi:hypothetical protein